SPIPPLVGTNEVITGGGGTVNVAVALPREFVTTSGPVTAPTGTRVVMPVGACDSTTAETPANVTCVSGSNRSPVIVTRLPAVALATWITPLGPLVICVSGGVLSTITTRVVAVVFVARSTVTAPRV